MSHKYNQITVVPEGSSHHGNRGDSAPEHRRLPPPTPTRVVAQQFGTPTRRQLALHGASPLPRGALDYVTPSRRMKTPSRFRLQDMQQSVNKYWNETHDESSAIVQAHETASSGLMEVSAAYRSFQTASNRKLEEEVNKGLEEEEKWATAKLDAGEKMATEAKQQLAEVKSKKKNFNLILDQQAQANQGFEHDMGKAKGYLNQLGDQAATLRQKVQASQVSFNRTMDRCMPMEVDEAEEADDEDVETDPSQKIMSLLFDEKVSVEMLQELGLLGLDGKPTPSFLSLVELAFVTTIADDQDLAPMKKGLQLLVESIQTILSTSFNNPSLMDELRGRDLWDPWTQLLGSLSSSPTPLEILTFFGRVLYSLDAEQSIRLFCHIADGRDSFPISD